MDWYQVIETEHLDEAVRHDVRENMGGTLPEKMTAREVLNRWLNWNGLIGFTGSIISVVDNIASVANRENERRL